jgi:hypothetical protein
MKTLILSLLITLAAFAQPAKESPQPQPQPKVQAFTATQVATFQEFKKRTDAIAKEQADMQRAWNAELKLVQMEFEQWVEGECKKAGSQNCGVNVQDQDAAKWTFLIPQPSVNGGTGTVHGDAGSIKVPTPEKKE